MAIMFSREERFRDKCKDQRAVVAEGAVQHIFVTSSVYIASDVPLGCIAHVDWSENPHGIPAFDKAERFKDPELSGQSKGL